jgi:hypothetical protein
LKVTDTNLYGPFDDDLLQLTTFSLAATRQIHSREVLNFTEIFGEIGGLIEIVFIVCIFLLSDIPEQSFILSLMSKFERDKKIKVSLFQKMKLTFHNHCTRCSRVKSS